MTTTSSNPRNLTILHVAQPTHAGVRVVVRDIVRDQVERGLTVHVACPETGGELHQDIQQCRATWHRWEARRSPGPSTTREARALSRLIRVVRPDLVHLHSSKAGMAGRLAVRGHLPTVFEPNAWSFLAVTGVMKMAAIRWERWAARWTHATICVSEEERQTGEALRIRTPMHVVPNGLQLSQWPAPEPNSRAAARRQLGLTALDEQTPIFVNVGRLCRQKGQDLLLQAWPQVRQSCPAARLFLVGDGADRSELQRLSDESVTFVGPSSAVRDWYLAADVVVMPSRWEGLSLALLEAMATERCVIAFDVEGMRDALSQNCGVLVTSGSIPDLAASMIQILNDPKRRRRLEGNARARVETQFDIHQKGTKVLSLYQSLVGCGH